MIQSKNGNVTHQFASWFGASKDDSDGNGVADSLSKWGLVFESFEIEVSGRGEIDLPVDTPEWLDDFVEQIPFNETRRYTRRVMETHAAYMWIYEGRWPEWPDQAQPGAKHDIDF